MRSSDLAQLFALSVVAGFVLWILISTLEYVGPL